MAIQSGEVVGIDDFIYYLNDEGKYAFEDTEEDDYRTGFIFDSYKVLNRSLILVSQKKDDKEFYGIISEYSHGFFLPCIFEKIKPYDDEYVKGKMNGEDFYIDKWGKVYTSQLIELYNNFE